MDASGNRSEEAKVTIRIDKQTCDVVYSDVGKEDAYYAAFMTEDYLVRGVILQAIANAEGIAPTAADVDAYVEEYLASVETPGGFETIEAFYEANPKEDVKLVLLQENVMGFLAETITIKDVK